MNRHFPRLVPNRLLMAALFLVTMGCADRHPEKNEATPLPPAHVKAQQDSIMQEHLVNGAWKHSPYSREWQMEIDAGLAKDSTIAYLWQQKAMPLFKQGKYELGMASLNKAVRYDRDRWQEYRAFINCIFVKNYREAIADFVACRSRDGNRSYMDHTYNFYIALCNIQLNQYTAAEQLLQGEIQGEMLKRGEENLHPTELYYLGIACYEQGKYEEAATAFARALKLYPQLSEALYYKGQCKLRLGNPEEAQALIQAAKEYGMKGYSLNEGNAIYEKYPYQIRRESWSYMP